VLAFADKMRSAEGPKEKLSDHAVENSMNANASSPRDAAATATLSATSRCIMLAAAFLGWMCAGMHLAINSLVMRVAAADLLPAGAGEGEIAQWFGWLTCAFLFGAATGGYLFGYLGDRIGRAKAMAASILCYSLFSAATYLVRDPTQLLLLRFLTCLGVGGIWPNGIALVSEAWPNLSRPFLAGAIGTAANVGILGFALLTAVKYVEPGDWRWTLLVGATPVFLGIVSWLMVPESPRWLAIQRQLIAETAGATRVGLGEIFRPPVLRTTIMGILLGTVPLFGGWGVANWANAWASEVGDTAKASESAPLTSYPLPMGEGRVREQDANSTTTALRAESDPALKSRTLIARSLPGSISSLLGGALAFWLGRKRSYFLLSLCALVCTQFLFRVDDPGDPESGFLFWNAALGFFSGFFFGWLPLCLPEMFPTRVRSAGAGVSFNWGRILAGVGVLVSAAVLEDALKGQYDVVGQYSGLVYALGMVVILLAPDTSDKDFND
jgi:MFS family permease